MAYDFDGSTDALITTLNARSTSPFYGGGSLSWWMYLDTFGGGGGFGNIFNHSDATQTHQHDNAWGVYLRDTNDSLLFFYQYDATYNSKVRQYESATNSITTGSWIHVLIAYDANETAASEDAPSVWIDGAADTPTAETALGSDGTALNFAGKSDGFLIGNEGYQQARAFDGRLAEVAFWDAELTLQDAQALASGISPLAVRSSNLLNYFPLVNGLQDEVGGNTLSNAAGVPYGAHPPVMRAAPIYTVPTPAKGKIWVNDAATWDAGAVQQTHPGTGWSATSIDVGQVIDTTGLTGQLYLILERADGSRSPGLPITVSTVAGGSGFSVIQAIYNTHLL